MQIIAGRFKNHPLKAPKGLETRPTSAKLRQAVFNILQNEIEDTSFLDVFCGSGAMGLEALSRGAKRAVFIDQSSFAIQALKENIRALKVEGDTFILPYDYLKGLKSLEKKNDLFSVIYVDPPYQLGPGKKPKSPLIVEECLHFLDHSPLLARGGKLFIEEGGKFVVQTELKNLHLVDERIHGPSYLYQFEKSDRDRIV